MTQEERTARINELEKEITQLRAEEQDLHNDPAKFEDERLRILGEAVKKVKDMTKEGDEFSAFVSASTNGEQSIFFGLGTTKDLAILLAVAVKEAGEVLHQALIKALLIARRMK